ncbi:hypothetical protein [Marinobacter sp.]|uniref:hypothetical protein n=1 Tax=Marinobacter sp. TaxID=50741 RepID=UPI0035661673
MKRLNQVGKAVQVFVEVGHRNGADVPGVWFFNGGQMVASADRLGPARMVAPGTVAVSASGRQWMAVGGDRINGAAGWSFVSPYTEQRPVDGDAVRFNDNPKALKIRAKLDAYLDYFQSVKGTFPDSIVLRREQLAVCGAEPGQFYKGIRLEAFS